MIVERKRRLDGTQVDFQCERRIVEPGVRAVVRFVTTSERRLEGTDLTLRPGTVTVGHFRADRPYTVYAFASDGAILGYYCSIVDELSIADDRVEYLDLVVDVLIDSRGGATVLDEDELPADLLDEDELPADLEPRHRRTISRALEDLTGNARRIVAELERETRRFL